MNPPSDAVPASEISGLTVLISGANSGIGLATAAWFARNGARVLVLARTGAKARLAAELIGGGDVRCFSADYTRFAEVRQAAAAILRDCETLDIIVNNAGRILREPARRTEDGHCESLQVNYLAHFLLTAQLLERLLTSPRPRLVNLSSRIHRTASGLRLDRMAGDHPSPLRAFAEAKALMVAFAVELNRRFGDKGLLARSIHPGIARSNVPDDAGLLLRLAGPLMIDTGKAAQNVVRAALAAPRHPEVVYFSGARPGHPLPLCLEPIFGTELWSYSVTATGGG